METDLFWYSLPNNSIAYYPSRQRDVSRLMIVDRATGAIEHKKFLDIADYMQPGDGLVINDTRVFKARFLLRRKTGGKLEIFLLEEVDCGEKNCWKVLTHPTRRIKEGEEVFFDDKNCLTIESKLPDGKTIISFANRAAAQKMINKFGHIPLPVYIHRPDEKRDENRYQTIYAHPDKKKSVAAPTAGLHFTNRALEKIKKKGVEIIPVTLHVGYGTFKKVKTERVEKHTVDAEYAELCSQSAKRINAIRAGGGKIFAVGTTSVRTLESAAMVNGKIQPYAKFVDLFIYPGYKFKAVDHLITNFHLPKSSLLFLVSAFASREKILEAYDIAVQEDYRFYSYGDCMLIL
jgi:S-adenosylmethionine:tRNA ribosyltransferase-isomerase